MKAIKSLRLAVQLFRSLIKRTNVFTISSYLTTSTKRAWHDSSFLISPLEYVHFVVEFRRLAHRVTPHKEEHP